MRALVEGIPSPVFEETPEAHQLRCHPDPVATLKERKELERKIVQLCLLTHKPEEE